MYSTYLRLYWEPFLLCCVIVALFLARGKGTQPTRRWLSCQLPSAYLVKPLLQISVGVSPYRVHIVVEMGTVMYCVCLAISVASVHGCEDLAQDYGVYHVSCPMEMPLGIFTVSLSHL